MVLEMDPGPSWWVSCPHGEHQASPTFQGLGAAQAQTSLLTDRQSRTAEMMGTLTVSARERSQVLVSLFLSEHRPIHAAQPGYGHHHSVQPRPEWGSWLGGGGNTVCTNTGSLALCLPQAGELRGHVFHVHHLLSTKKI